MGGPSKARGMCSMCRDSMLLCLCLSVATWQLTPISALPAIDSADLPPQEEDAVISLLQSERQMTQAQILRAENHQMETNAQHEGEADGLEQSDSAVTQLQTSSESSDDNRGKTEIIVTVVLCSIFVLSVGILVGFTIGRVRGAHRMYRESVKATDIDIESESIY